MSDDPHEPDAPTRSDATRRVCASALPDKQQPGALQGMTSIACLLPLLLFGYITLRLFLLLSDPVYDLPPQAPHGPPHLQFLFAHARRLPYLLWGSMFAPAHSQVRHQRLPSRRRSLLPPHFHRYRNRRASQLAIISTLLRQLRIRATPGFIDGPE
ncbi:hypothetical protein BU26DRAFT_70421 [Trematosphaeria pertusa]|uniref:Uncharacterized protein n=1 Tax=Trematosphaeria pertusa TaxID=390896 RepID=A0A6A6I5L4_9PLEO|nr:uncharacterized protein BU26DRAFT_70421 [Trematosphaeria pertusa]KAF2245519.1 hypothetical protein BU26DRAFT_70421 [Trematosphaeria pertusa]